MVYSKVYGMNERTRNGLSKFGWRLVIANVDNVFMESLESFPTGYGFRLGASTVQIRPINSTSPPSIPPASAAPRNDGQGQGRGDAANGGSSQQPQQYRDQAADGSVTEREIK